MTAPWFHLATLPGIGETAELDAREARHAIGARRLRDGDRIRLFDGGGVVATAALEAGEGGGARVSARIVERTVVPLPPPIHLAAALPKGERQRVLLNMATQIGMRSFIPLTCERTVVPWTPAFAERGRRVCLEACKQSRRAHLPALREPMTPEQVASRLAETDGCAVLAHPGHPPLREVISAGPADREIALLVGPEGGFSDAEVRAVVAAGGRIASLGEGTLRIETAAIAMLSFVSMITWGRSDTDPG